jgi:hypothetical protein
MHAIGYIHMGLGKIGNYINYFFDVVFTFVLIKILLFKK